MKKIFALFICCGVILLTLSGCSMLFNSENYNPNPTPKPVVEEVVAEPDTVKTIIIID